MGSDGRQTVGGGGSNQAAGAGLTGSSLFNMIGNAPAPPPAPAPAPAASPNAATNAVGGKGAGAPRTMAQETQPANPLAQGQGWSGDTSNLAGQQQAVQNPYASNQGGGKGAGQARSMQQPQQMGMMSPYGSGGGMGGYGGETWGARPTFAQTQFTPSQGGVNYGFADLNLGQDPIAAKNAQNQAFALAQYQGALERGGNGGGPGGGGGGDGGGE